MPADTTLSPAEAAGLRPASSGETEALWGFSRAQLAALG